MSLQQYDASRELEDPRLTQFDCANMSQQIHPCELEQCLIQAINLKLLLKNRTYDRQTIDVVIYDNR